MEITFSRTSQYSVDVEGSDLAVLASRLHMSTKKLKVLIEDGALNSEQKDDIAAWLDEMPAVHTVSEEGQIEDLELHL
jgi:hypothetical protein